MTSVKEILPYIYSDIGVLHENMSQIILDDLLGFINGKGEIVIKPKYDTPLNYQDLCVFKSGKATVSKSDKYGAIDTTGKVVIKFSQHQLGRINTLFPYKKKELWGYMNLNGKSIVDPIYNYAEDIKDGSCLVQKDTLFGCLDSKGKILIPIKFDNIQQLNETPYLIVQKNSLLGIIKTNGEARRLIRGNGARINDIIVNDENYILSKKDFKNNKVKISSGKKRHGLLTT